MEIKQLLGERLGLEIVLRRSMQSSLIVTPPGFEKKTDEAIVRYLGEDYKGALQVGDRVIYDRFKGELVKLAEVEIHFINASDVIAQVVE